MLKRLTAKTSALLLACTLLGHGPAHAQAAPVYSTTIDPVAQGFAEISSLLNLITQIANEISNLDTTSLDSWLNLAGSLANKPALIASSVPGLLGTTETERATIANGGTSGIQQILQTLQKVRDLATQSPSEVPTQYLSRIASTISDLISANQDRAIQAQTGYNDFLTSVATNHNAAIGSANQAKVDTQSAITDATAAAQACTTASQAPTIYDQLKGMNTCLSKQQGLTGKQVKVQGDTAVALGGLANQLVDISEALGQNNQNSQALLQHMQSEDIKRQQQQYLEAAIGNELTPITVDQGIENARNNETVKNLSEELVQSLRQQ